MHKKISLVCFFTVMLTVACNLSIFSFPANANSLAQQLVKLSEKQLIKEGHGEPLAQSQEGSVQFITLSLQEFTDNAGLTYLGGVVKPSEIESYLAQLKRILTTDYNTYRAAQKLRDHKQFHITLINPFEYEKLSVKQKSTLNLKQHYAFKLLGLGKVSNQKGASYFVVAKSQQAQNFRQQFKLSKKDFHITLGFNPQDIYGVKKDERTLLK